MGKVISFKRKPSRPSKEELLKQLSREEVPIQKCLRADFITEPNGKDDFPFDLKIEYKVSYELPSEPFVAALLVPAFILDDPYDMKLLLTWIKALARDMEGHLQVRWEGVNREEEQ